MKRHLIFVILCVALCVLPGLAAMKQVDVNEWEVLTQADRFFVIQRNITLPEDSVVVVGSRSVLCFEGGSFSGGRLDINGAFIQAAEYCIFDSTTTIIKKDGSRCNFGNDEVSAAWFGQVGEDGDIGPAICTRASNLLIDIGAIERVGGTGTGDSPTRFGVVQIRYTPFCMGAGMEVNFG